MKKDVNNKWTSVISAKNNFFNLNLVEIFHYKDLIYTLIKRDIVSIYKQTVLGPVWFLFGPLFTVFTYTFTFNQIAGLSTDGVPAPVFYLAGTVLWNYLNSCFAGASYVLQSNVHIFGKVYFPRLIPSIALTISNLLKMGLQFLVFLLFCIYFQINGDIKMNSLVLLSPILVAIMAMMGLGIGLFVASITVKYRDAHQLTGPFLMLLMYASPIIYPSSSVPAFLKPYLSINPISPIIEFFRYAFTGAGEWSVTGIFYSLIFSIIALIVGILIFNKVEKNFIDAY